MQMLSKLSDPARRASCALAMVAAILIAAKAAPATQATLEKGVVVTSPQATTPIAKAAEMLRDEVQKRTGLRLESQTAFPGESIPVIALGIAGAMPPGTPQPGAGAEPPQTAEAYSIWVDTAARKAPTVCVAGRDAQGVLFGVGRLLRTLHMKKEELSLDAQFRANSSPRYPVRAHELGYRNKSNTYDAWTVAQYEQYIRDLAVFGSNGIQLVVQLDTMTKDGPHMTEPVMERTVKLAKLLDDYGLRVWIWLAPSEKPITAETAPAVLEKCRALFEQCARIDAVFVPGGDPGGTPPGFLLPLIKDMATLLHNSHPHAEMWVSNEEMPHDWNTALFDALAQDQPDWLTGVVFGTWVKISLQEERKRVPQRYRIVQYADITHSLECQYPVPEWDRAFALTLGREPINPRPIATAHIHNLLAPLTSGFVTYSDGVNDDVNKIVWTAMGWDPDTKIETVLNEYGRYFVGEDYAADVAKGLLALEQNWRGALDKNTGVEKTLALWQTLETAGGARFEDNWRFQMGLFRAYYDAYIRTRLFQQNGLEQNVRAELKRARKKGVETAVHSAQAILAQADTQPAGAELRRRIEASAERLFKTIGMQLSVAKYGAANWERGAVLDALDMPLNDRPWLEARLKDVLAAPDDAARNALLDATLNWDDPGQGGFYDDLGNADRQPHLVHLNDWNADPGSVATAQVEFIEIKGREAWRKSWLDQAQTLFGTPLQMHYEGLDPKQTYRMRVTYTGRFSPSMRLTANEQFLLHDFLPQPKEPAPVEFAIPPEATAKGVLDLKWDLAPGSRSGARGCQVAEVWLMRK